MAGAKCVAGFRLRVIISLSTGSAWCFQLSLQLSNALITGSDGFIGCVQVFLCCFQLACQLSIIGFQLLQVAQGLIQFVSLLSGKCGALGSLINFHH